MQSGWSGRDRSGPERSGALIRYRETQVSQFSLFRQTMGAVDCRVPAHVLWDPRESLLPGEPGRGKSGREENWVCGRVSVSFFEGPPDPEIEELGEEDIAHVAPPCAQ